MRVRWIHREDTGALVAAGKKVSIYGFKMCSTSAASAVFGSGAVGVTPINYIDVDAAQDYAQDTLSGAMNYIESDGCYVTITGTPNYCAILVQDLAGL